MDEEADREISDHVLRMQRYRAPGEAEGSGITRFRNFDDLFRQLVYSINIQRIRVLINVFRIYIMYSICIKPELVTLGPIFTPLIRLPNRTKMTMKVQKEISMRWTWRRWMKLSSSASQWLPMPVTLIDRRTGLDLLGSPYHFSQIILLLAYFDCF